MNIKLILSACLICSSLITGSAYAGHHFTCKDVDPVESTGACYTELPPAAPTQGTICSTCCTTNKGIYWVGAGNRVDC